MSDDKINEIASQISGESSGVKFEAARQIVAALVRMGHNADDPGFKAQAQLQWDFSQWEARK